MKNINLNVDWEKDPKLKRWLKNKKEGTRASYLSAFRAYTEFTGMTTEQLIEESDKELELKPSERGRPERRLRAFFNWLQEEYERKKRGKIKGEVIPVGEREVTGEKGVTSEMAKTYVAAIRGFYSEFHYKTYFSKGTFDSEPENRRFNWTIDDIREFVEHAKSTRDRAIILCQFQGGMDDSTLCSLNYWHVAKELEGKNAKIPMLLDIKRGKISESHITFLAEDAVNALKAYLAERRRKEQYDLGPNDPIFVRESWKRYKKQRIRPKIIQDLFRKLALECGFVTEEELKKTHWNPARAHALRGAFMSLLRSTGMNQEDIDFFVGHKIPHQKAYYQEERETLRKTYAEAMHVLAVFTSTSYKVFEDRLNEQGIAIKTLLSEREERKKKIEELESTVNQLAIKMAGREYGGLTHDRRQLVSILGLLEGSPETRKFAIKDLKAQLERR